MAGIFGESSSENILPVFGFQVNAGMRGCHLYMHVFCMNFYVDFVERDIEHVSNRVRDSIPN